MYSLCRFCRSRCLTISVPRSLCEVSTASVLSIVRMTYTCLDGVRRGGLLDRGNTTGLVRPLHGARISSCSSYTSPLKTLRLHIAIELLFSAPLRSHVPVFYHLKLYHTRPTRPRTFSTKEPDSRFLPSHPPIKRSWLCHGQCPSRLWLLIRSPCRRWSAAMVA